jgi:hypothetical protein
MHVLPDTKEERIALLLFPFKACVVICLVVALLPMFPPIGKLFSKFETVRTFDLILGEFLLNGYFLCIPVLVAGSFFQLHFNQRKESLLTMLWAFTPIILYFSILDIAKIGEIAVSLWHRYCNMT